MERALVGQFLRFGTIGVGATTVHFTVLLILVEALDVGAIAASSAAFCVAAGFSYLLNRTWTFGSSRAHRAAVPRFFMVAVFGLLLNATVMYVGVHVLQAWYIAAQLVSAVVVPVSNFTLNKLWTFSA
jgi:putative flippase GtrA